MTKKIEYVKFRDIEDRLDYYIRKFHKNYPDASYNDFIEHIELDSCPFCGFKATINTDSNSHFGWCAMCGAEGPKSWNWVIAAKSWNDMKSSEWFNVVCKYNTIKEFEPYIQNFSKDIRTQKMLKEFIEYLRKEEEKNNAN